MMSAPLEGNAPKLAAAVIVIAFFSFVALPLRIWVRVTSRNWGWDDWSICVAAPLFAALSAACLGGPFEGIGVHEDDLSNDEKVTGRMFFFLFEVFWCVSIIPTKLSISFMLMRIAGPKRTFVRSLWAVSALFTTMNMIAFFYIIFECKPVSYAWDTSTPGGHCKPQYILADIYYATTAINIATDWFYALLPLPLLWSVPLNTNSKISVGFLLSLGILASLSACIRLKYTIALTSSTDYLYSIANVVVWGYAEVGIGFFVSCLATLRPLFKKVLQLSPSSGHRSTRKEQDFEMMSSQLRPGGGKSAMLASLSSKVVGKKDSGAQNTRRSSWIPSEASEENLVVQDTKVQGIYVSRSVLQSMEARDAR